ncbi:bacillithiol biosynthesis cysteine-adding enzyme BshC [Flavobacteriaceae bacterium AU392]|nr:bacillithiol biosynthesis cysteine-adding enzyme BshC [Flavobacteriaceae bacterium]RKM83725.1 bacillithiol biosynthesis cysteine-adding enzyme BshC [Flavobacteriaceae bacterium AU392]
MPTECLSFRDTNYFSSLICDYLDEKPELKTFYNRFPKLENFKAQIIEKQDSFPNTSRVVLENVLKQQYASINTSLATQKHIESLRESNTFTITTGHQLNLFTGPLYFLYKIISAINLAKELKVEYPEYNFVPVYWMASEDHDFDEINFFNFKGKKIQWQREASGAVGELKTEGLDEVFKMFSSELGQGKNADFLKNLFEEGYLKHDNLTDATRYIANTLFGEQGLVIVDANNSELKRLFIPFIEEDLVKNTSYKEVSQTCESLKELGHKIQVNPREINLFYLINGLRERIVETNEGYQVNETSITWSKTDLLAEVNEFPERFSPNVIMRPLYQEVILPNLCYIGGGGELAYWFEFKTFFETVNVPFPMLLLRNSTLVKTAKQTEKQKKLNLSLKDLFLNQQVLVNQQVKNLSEIDIDFTDQRAFLKSQFENLYTLADQTDKSFLGAVAAQEKKQLKGLNNLEKRLLKAQKRKLSEQVTRIKELQNELFPGQSLQERNLNFSELYLEFGNDLIFKLITELKPLSKEFLVIGI